MRNTTLYGVAATDTFRANSEGITVDFINKIKKGTNLQNIEKSMRRMYIPDDGKRFVQTDQAGAEAKIVAYLCRDGNFRALFDNNIKPHVFVALHLFSQIWEKKLNEFAGDIKLNISEVLETPIPQLRSHRQWKELDKLIKLSDNWSAAERYYYIGKQVCHSSNYDAGVNMFRMNTLEKSRGKVVISKQEGEKYMTFYHSLFPEIREMHREIRSIVEKTRTLYNLFGFPRYFGRELDERYFKAAYAFIPQSTVGCITHIAYTKMQEFIESNKLDWDLLANTHDSYLLQCSANEALECARVSKAFMEQKLISPAGVEFQMGAEVSIGDNWGPYKKGTNEDGLQEVQLN